jgi:putative FmdB family regulatory protein
MPIYDYRCARCKHLFEKLILAKTETVSCPECASREVERQVSAFHSPGLRAAGASECGCTPATCGCH